MKTISNKELKEIIQSGHINLLLGSGCSRDYLATLQDIEERMNNEATKEAAQKDYYKLILKSKAVLDETLETSPTEKRKLLKTRQNYDSFLGFWVDTVAKRSLHIVNKQINIFTTNFDMFIEASCERLNIPYNDGFAGQINPVFSVSNFNKIQKYKSLQFDNTSDIPLFNIIKLHGSLSWQAKDEVITYSNGQHIENGLDTKTGTDFDEGYKQIAVINPNAEKHFETVLNRSYASMLRKFTLELEKENSVLLIAGFSLSDKHIKDLLYGVMKSNPTLVVIYFAHSPYNEASDKLNEKKNPNLYIISPETEFSLEEITAYISKIFNDKPEVHEDGE
ncbi:MAG TPA: SIR2 family protein [Candidatus Saccharimonadia bacterium]|nr:SIR2 family protein [Candidatus Saccharimonadia bacterium]